MKNLAGLMKQAQQMQSKMQEMQAKLEGMEIDGEAGAGLVTVTLNGKGDLRRIKIDPKVVDPADAEMLEDLIVAAHAQRQGRSSRPRRRRRCRRSPAACSCRRDEAAVLDGAHPLSLRPRPVMPAWLGHPRLADRRRPGRAKEPSCRAKPGRDRRAFAHHDGRP